MTTWCPDGHLYSKRAEFPIDAILIISFYAYINRDFYLEWDKKQVEKTNEIGYTDTK